MGREIAGSFPVTGSQRLVQMYRYLSEGGRINPGRYAQEFGIVRAMVYYYLKVLRNMGVPIVNSEYGEWKLGSYSDVEVNALDFVFGAKTQSRMGQIVNLYRTLVRGELVSPTKYAKRVGTHRQTVYYQLDLLSGSGIDVINLREGWTLLEYVECAYE